MNAPNPAQTFLLEAAELLDRIESCALAVEQNPADTEAVNCLFRAFHTIKGSGAMFGFDAVAEFTHEVETLLDRVRSGAMPVTRRLVELLLLARDRIKALLDDPAEAASAATCELVSALRALAKSPPPAPPAPAAAVVSAGPEGPLAKWRIRFRPPVNIAANGSDPLALLAELRTLGACRVVARADAVPPLETLDPEQCHLFWEIELETGRGRNAIEDVFIFVADQSEIAIDPLPAAAASPAPEAAAPVAAVPAPKPRSAGRAPAPARATPVVDASVRVPSARLDRLVNLVGELVMNQSRLTQAAQRLDEPDLNVPVEDLERLIAELRDTVLGIRMMPIGTTFTRFKRLVHDLSAELGKEIDLVTEGAETELDKTVLDQLGDPLVHLLRNCIDHGIEPPEERVRSGKPRRGTIRLAASHVGSNVALVIADDGRGLDVEAIRAKAVELKLVSPEAALSEREIFNLILLPGFSTAKRVTAVSGRGVGMDVVKRELEALGGTIGIESAPGRGTSITATLPLTLAIIDGLLVEIAGDRFVIPMAAVYENVELAGADRVRRNGRNVTTVRGSLVPYLPLRALFACPGAAPELEKIVIVRHGADRVGLVVDRVLGSHQTVIQSLGRFYRGIGAFSGATIMGDGRVALILDIAGLVRLAGRAEAAAA